MGLGCWLCCVTPVVLAELITVSTLNSVDRSVAPPALDCGFRASLGTC